MSRASSTCWSSAAAWSARARRSTPPPAACESASSRPATTPRGTSSRSSKLIHGGLRYLEMLDFGLVARGAAGARAADPDRLAPHLVRPVPFLYPLQHRVWERLYVGAGVAALRHDGRCPGTPAGVPHHRHLTRRRALRRRRRCARTRWSARCSTTTPRSTTPGTPCSLARTAAAYGAHVANRTRVIDFLREGERVSGARGAGPRDRRGRSRCAPGRSSTPPACGPTTPRRWPASAASSTCGRPRACTSWCPATGSSSDPG